MNPQPHATDVPMVNPIVNRRSFLRTAGAASSLGWWTRPSFAAEPTTPPKSVAAVVTIYREHSHTDVLIGKILEGWQQQGGIGPRLHLASMYVDQFPADDLARKKSEQHRFPIFKSIEQAITLGGDRVAVDGVISVGEHGDYPWNDLGQHLYPRRRFFREITDTFEKYDRVVPVFNDKHPGPVWADAKWMYDRAVAMNIPFMAGSSLPVSFRQPDFSLPMNSQVEGCLAIGYSGLDIYGFHTLDYLQAVIERRRTDTQGVRSVQCLPGDRIKDLIARQVIRQDLLDHILRLTPKVDQQLLEVDAKEFNVFLVQYADGLLVPVLMLPGYAKGISVVVKAQGMETMGGVAEERGQPFPHFAYLLKGIEQMIYTGQPAYPVERTLLAAGILDRVLTSRARQGAKIETPELMIDYQAIDYPHAPHIDLLNDQYPTRRTPQPSS